MLYFSVNSRLKMRQLVRLFLVVLSFFFSVKIGYTGNIDQLYRSVPLLIGQLETKTDGLTEPGSACYGSGENLKIRVSVAISPGRKYLVREKLHFKGLLKSFCETNELCRVARR